MTEMIEKVARAIFNAWAKEEGAESTWDDVCRRAMEGYPYAKKWHRMAISEARAAIKALREPNDAMLENVYHDPGFCDEPGEVTPDVEIWKSMIDAALGDDT